MGIAHTVPEEATSAASTMALSLSPDASQDCISLTWRDMMLVAQTSHD